jgi:hypothetical protein
MRNNKQQTAVDSIIAKLNNVTPTEFCSIETIKKWCLQAKEMQKDQHIKSWETGLMKVDFNEYYNETYGGGEQ